MTFSKTDLENAIHENRIVPYFQPLVELPTGRVLGFEALARWLHPLHGLIEPSRFIPVAESSGLSHDLSFSITRQVVEAALPLPAHIGFCVNISPLQLRDASLPRTMEDAVRAGNHSGTFSLDRLTVEITESAFVHNIDQAAAIAARLKEMGLRLSLDDFGTGYSSLLHLQALPFDTIKVDKSFVQCMVQRRESLKIVSAVVSLGLSLGLTTVAEGVELETQAAILRRLGCELGQGWLFGHPMPACDLPAFLAAHPAVQPDSAQRASSLALSINTRNPPSLQLAHLQSLYESAPVGLCLVDRQMNVVSANQRLAGTFPFQSGTPLCQALEKVDPHAARQLQGLLLRALGGESIHRVKINWRKSGLPDKPASNLVFLEPVIDEYADVAGVSLSILDVTRRRRVHQGLHYALASLATIWDHAPCGLIVAHAVPQGCILHGNHEAERLLGHPIEPPAHDETGKLWRMFNTDAQPIAWQDNPLVRAMKDGSSLPPNDFLYQRADDSLVRLKITAAPIRKITGEIIGSVMTLAGHHEKHPFPQHPELTAALAVNLWTASSAYLLSAAPPRHLPSRQQEKAAAS